ncbi:TrkH family potassium uptake protein [Sorangium sp. So ce1097]|uniref:TrkH family potassium uptake protein n=1 Tax=Sorangium sp. So ce1097 TaxID=3133330 RepID=UPI003F61B51B
MLRVDPSPTPSWRPSAPRTEPPGDPEPPSVTLATLARPAVAPAEAGAPSAAPAAARRRRASSLQPAPLLLGSAVLLGFDLALAITPLASVALTALETLLVPAWIAAVVSMERVRRALAGARVEARKPRLALFLLALVLLLACIGEKWLLLLGPGAADAGPRGLVLYRSYTVLAFLVALGGLLGRRPIERLLATAAEHPARLMVLSFGVATLLGSFLLTLPQSLRSLDDASFVDGLFMSASAVCVTGLSLHSISETYTPFGQAVLLLMVQIGGLGIMVLSTFFAIVAGRKLRLRDAAVMAEMIDAESFARLRRNLAAIVLFTLGIEAVGALALLFSFLPHHQIAAGPIPGEPLSGAGDHLWAAVFHAVSAYCNAGFSLFTGGLVPLVGSPAASGVLASLVILGSLGFPVHDELLRRARLRLRGERPPRMSLHSRIVLIGTAVLLAVGTAGFLLLEWRRSMGELSWPVKLLASFFQSAMTRSAGLNTVDYGLMGPATLMLTCMLMFIGAAPGSTGGGIKITTAAALFAALRAEMRGDEAPHLFGRAIPAATVRRALGMASLMVMLVSGFLLVMLTLEPHHPMGLAMETVSALATAGLSANITPTLSAPGKLVMTLAMFIGRIGPLTIAMAFATQARTRSYRLPEEKIGIG